MGRVYLKLNFTLNYLTWEKLQRCVKQIHSWIIIFSLLRYSLEGRGWRTHTEARFPITEWLPQDFKGAHSPANLSKRKSKGSELMPLKVFKYLERSPTFRRESESTKYCSKNTFLWQDIPFYMCHSCPS